MGFYLEDLAIVREKIKKVEKPAISTRKARFIAKLRSQGKSEAQARSIAGRMI